MGRPAASAIENGCHAPGVQIAPQRDWLLARTSLSYYVAWPDVLMLFSTAIPIFRGLGEQPVRERIMSEILIREFTNGDVFALDKLAGELIIIDKQDVQDWRSAGGDIDAARDFVRRGHAHCYDNAMLQELQSALIHIPVLV